MASPIHRRNASSDDLSIGYNENHRNALHCKYRHNSAPNWKDHVIGTANSQEHGNRDSHFKSSNSNQHRKRRGDNVSNIEKEAVSYDEPWVKRKRSISIEADTNVNKCEKHNKVCSTLLD